MTVLPGKSVDPPDESGLMPGHDPLPANTPALRGPVRQLATCKLDLRRDTADRLAIERGENEGMTVSVQARRLPGTASKRGHYPHVIANR